MPAGVAIAAICGFVAVLVTLTILIVRRVRGTPEKREQNRRLAVNRSGRLGDAMIIEASENAIYYSYSVRGVQYEASQDISTLRDRVPAELERIIGALASLKYSPNNPANSILICEEWSGLRVNPPGRASADVNRVRHQP